MFLELLEYFLIGSGIIAWVVILLLTVLFSTGVITVSDNDDKKFRA